MEIYEVTIEFIGGKFPGDVCRVTFSDCPCPVVGAVYHNYRYTDAYRVLAVSEL